MSVFPIIPYDRMMFERSFIRGKTFDTLIEGQLASVGDSQNFWVLDSSNSYVEKSATCKKVSDHCYIFLEDDKAIPDEQIELLVRRFEMEAGIRERLRDKFGSEFSPGIDVDDKIYILLCDMGTFGQSHYATNDNTTTSDKRFPIDGYYSYLDELPKTVFSSSNQKEIIYLNTDLFRFFPDNEVKFNPVYNVLSREYFRMIHFNEEYISHNLGTIGSSIPDDGVEEIWVDYGLAFYATRVATGKIDQRYIEAATRRPFNSFIMFEESLANIACSDSDLALSGLFFMYLDQVKGQGVGDNQLIKDIVKEPDDGISAIDSRITSDITEVVHDFLKAVYIDDSRISSKYDIYGVELEPMMHNLLPDDTSYECPDYDYYISPSLYMRDVNQLKMGSSVAFSVRERFWPQRYVSMRFNDLQGADRLKVDFLVLDGGELVKEYEYNVDSFENLITWNDTYAAGDELQIIISDISNGLVKTGDYKFDYYVPGETEEVFINRFTQYISRVSTDFQIDFVKPEIKMTVFPSPFTEDYLNAVVISEGQVSMNLKRPDDSEENLALTKVKNTQDRYISVFNAQDVGTYTAEVGVIYEDGLVSKKKYVFDVHEFLDGKNIIPSEGNASLVMRKASENMKFLFMGDDDSFTINSMDEGEFIFEHSMPFMEKKALFKVDGEEYTLLKGNKMDGSLLTEVNQGGKYAVVKDTKRPEIDFNITEDKYLNILVDDIALDNIEVVDQNKNLLYKGNKKEIIIDLAQIRSDITVKAVDVFDNQASARFTIQKKAAGTIGFCKVYPNPSTEFVEFEFSSTSNKNTIRIYDSSGRGIKVIRDFELFNNGTTYSYVWLLEDRNFNQVHNGVYFYKIFVEGEERLDGKIAVSR